MKIYPPCHRLTGGPAAFCRNLSAYLELKTEDLENCFMVINGPKKFVLSVLINKYLKQKFMILRLGSPIRSNISDCEGFLYYIRFLPSYLLMIFFTFIADDVIVQSRFTHKQWSRKLSAHRMKKFRVIYNPQSFCGVPRLVNFRTSDVSNLICVEGTLPAPSNCYALDVLKIHEQSQNCNLYLFGNYDPDQWREYKAENIKLMGMTERQYLVDAFYSADVYVCSDNKTSSCPNSVIDALSFGLPVIAPVNTPGWELNALIQDQASTGQGVTDIKEARVRASAKIFDPALIFEDYFRIFQTMRRC